METKSFYLSKTFWVNIVALVVLIVQQFTGFIIDVSAQAAILIVINLILRAITGEPIDFGGKVIGKKI